MVTAKCFLLSLPDLGFLPVAHNCPDSPPGATGLPGQEGSKGGAVQAPAGGMPVVPAELFRVPAHWPRRPTVATEGHGHPVPLTAGQRRVRIEAGSGVRSLTKTVPQDDRPFVLSWPVPAEIHFCFPLPSSSNCPRAGAKGRPRHSPRDPAPGHPSMLSGALNTGLPTFRGALSAPPETSDICSRHASQFCVLTKSSPQSQRGIEVPPQKPTGEGA